MAKKQPFDLIYDPQIRNHLDAIEPKYHSLVRAAIEQQLRFEPDSPVQDDEEVEHLLLAHSPRLGAILDAAESRVDRGEGVPHEEFWREVEAADRARPKNGSAKKPRAKRRP